MTDRPTDTSGTPGRRTPEPDVDETATRPAVTGSEEKDAEKTKVAGMSPVSEDASSDGSTTSTEGPAKQTLAGAAMAKLEEARRAMASRSDSEPREDTLPRPNNPKSATATRPRAPRRARLRLTRIDPWSVMKTAFLLSIAFAVVTVVAVGMVWQVLGAAGVWDSINDTVQSGIGGDEVSSFEVQDYVGTSRVLGFTMLVAAIDVVLITAAATLSAFLYNMAAALLGGVEVTLSEDVD